MEIKRLPFGQSHADKIRAAELKWRGMPPGIPPDMAIEFMAKLKAGSTVRKLTGGGTLGPAFVSYQRFKKHCELNPIWAADARITSDANSRRNKGARLRNLTHCIHGHPLSGANIKYEPNGRRKCLTCVKRREKAPRPPTEEQIQQVTAALNAGKTLSLICQGTVDGKRVAPRVVTFRKLGFYRRLNPSFDRFVIEATAANNSKGQQRRWHNQPVHTAIIRAQNNDYYKIMGIVPVYLPADIRDDIAQSIMLALLEGSLRRDQVTMRVRQFVTDHNRMFPTKFAKFGDSPLVSLDEVMFEDGSTTRGDTVSRGLWD
jgi:hypothetical protein